jgi:hypothetical protein
MAPEYPPSLVVFDAQMENDRLRGWCEYIEPNVPGTRLRVSWSAEIPPEGYKAVGGGVAYINPEFTSTRNLHQGPTNEGEYHYRWSEGLNLGIPWVMFIFVLPLGYTLTEMNPSPAGTKLFGNRLALYWMLAGDTYNRTQVAWTLSPLDSHVDRELVRLSRLRLGFPVTSPVSIAVDDSSRIQSNEAGVATQRNPWKSGSFYLIALIIVFASVVVTYRYVGAWALPAVLVASLLLLVIVGALQLRNDEALKDETFLRLMSETLKRLPLLRSGRSGIHTK